MIITVKEFKEMLLNCDPDWSIKFSKWEHISTVQFPKSNRMPSLVSVCIQDIIYRRTDDGDVIYKIILEDDFDNEFVMKRDEMIKVFCSKKDDDEMLNFVLYTEDTPGHYNHVPLTISIADKGYSDKVMIIDFEEEK